MKATFKYRPWNRVFWQGWVLTVFCCASFQVSAWAAPRQAYENYVLAQLQNARQLCRPGSFDPTNAAILACACYDAANMASNKQERARLAREGVESCRKALKINPQYAPAHYYLGMDLGQLAKVEVWSALFIVKEMEREFKAASVLDPLMDYAGPERNLGLLYQTAPRITSVGNRHKARVFLEKARQLAPQYPENQINLAEDLVKYGEITEARKVYQILSQQWNQAQARFQGVEWSASWDDWTARKAALAKILETQSHGNVNPGTSSFRVPVFSVIGFCADSRPYAASGLFL